MLHVRVKPAQLSTWWQQLCGELQAGRRSNEIQNLYAVNQRFCCSLDNLPTNRLMVNQVAHWSTGGLVKLTTANFQKSWNYTCTLDLCLTLSTTVSVQIVYLPKIISRVIIIYSKFLIKSFGELRVDLSVTWLTASCRRTDWLLFCQYSWSFSFHDDSVFLTRIYTLASLARPYTNHRRQDYRIGTVW